MKYQRVYSAVMDRPWALLPEKLAAIVEILELRAAGGELSADEIEARVGRRDRPSEQRAGAVAVLPLYGIMAQRMNLMTAMSGGTSTQVFGQAFRQLVNDPDVGAIVLDVDSPGGDVFGTAELADTVHAARGRKPIVAVANSLMASAAYWVASQADEVVVTPSGQVGSIGVFTAHRDISAKTEAAGERLTLISAGKYKTEGNPYEPLSDEARAAVQEKVDAYYALFVDAVARGRAVTSRDVRDGFGQGRTVGARDAVRLGMADRVATLDATLERLQGTIPAPVTVLRSEAPPLEHVSGAGVEWRRRRLALAQLRRPVT